MENDNDVILDTQNETGEEAVETPEVAETPEETPEVDVDQLQATNKKLYERAKKAEAELKTLRGTPPAKPSAQVSSQIDPIEAAFLVNGMSPELLQELKTVAKVRGTDLLKAQTDPIFVAVKEKFEKDKKQQEASLPASRGSGGMKPKKDFTTPGLSREDHKKMVMESR